MREERQRVSERARARVGTVVVASCLALLAPPLTGGTEATPRSTSGGDDSCSIPKSLRRTRPDPEGRPVRIEIALRLVDVIEINEVVESFKVDFVMDLRCLIYQRSIRRDQEADVDIAADGSVQFSERVFVELSSPLDMRDFPFDRQELRIEIASFEYGRNDVVFTVVPSSDRLETVSMAGWEIHRNWSEADVAPTVPSEHARVVYRIFVVRDAGYYVWAAIVPLCFIALMAWSVFWLDPAAWAPQIGVSTATIFTLIAFRLGLRQLLPRTSYLTRADELVLWITALVFLALAEVIVTSRLAQRDRVSLARRIDQTGRWVYLALFLGILFFTLTG
jgi:hypothetical protein